MIPPQEFDFYMSKAEAAIGLYTFGRSRECEDEAVKMALTELCGYYYHSRNRSGIESESNDGLSVKYERGGKSPESGIIKLWLGETGLMNPKAEGGRDCDFS